MLIRDPWALSECMPAEANIILTSAGLNTEPIRQHMHDTIGSLAVQKLRVLRITDGWQSFAGDDGVPAHEALMHKVESAAAKSWSRAWLKYTFGKNLKIQDVLAGSMNSPAFEQVTLGADVLLVPGGNSFLTAKGIRPHQEKMNDLVRGGNIIYVGESAGSIVAGKSLAPALLSPADTQPKNANIDWSLGIVNAEIVVHAPGRQEKFGVPGIQSFAANRILPGYETPPEEISRFTESHDVIKIHDAQAIVSFAGRTATIGE